MSDYRSLWRGPTPPPAPKPVQDTTTAKPVRSITVTLTNGRFVMETCHYRTCRDAMRAATITTPWRFDQMRARFSDKLSA